MKAKMQEFNENLISKIIHEINGFLRQIDFPVIDSQRSGNEMKINESEIAAHIDKLSTGLKDIVDSFREAEASKIVDPAVVQITASKQQLDDRISAFISHSQNAVDEQNVQEFCQIPEQIKQSGCARTDARYKPRMKNATHLQVSRAMNIEGPQLRVTAQGVLRSPKSSRQQQTKSISHPIEERLGNLESHLNIKPNPAYSNDIYMRLKDIENRVLQLEGSSPEYFANPEQLKQQNKTTCDKKDQREYTLQEIDDRIRHLKQELSTKKSRLETTITDL